MGSAQDSEDPRSAESDALIHRDEPADIPPTARTGLTRRVTRLVSPRAFATAIPVISLGLIVGRVIVPFPLVSGLGGLVGMAAAAFLLGLRGGTRRYLETAAAGIAVAGIAAFLDYFALAALGAIGLPLVALTTGAGGIVAVIGHYFGRDLHAGLTAEL